MNQYEIGSEFLSQKEVASFFRTSEATVWRLRKNGLLTFHRIMGRVLFRKSDLEDFLSRQRRGTKEENEKNK